MGRRKGNNPASPTPLAVIAVGVVGYLLYRKLRGLGGNGDTGYALPSPAEPSGQTFWQSVKARAYMPIRSMPALVPQLQEGTKVHETPTQRAPAIYFDERLAKLPTDMTEKLKLKQARAKLEPGQFNIKGEPAGLDIEKLKKEWKAEREIKVQAEIEKEYAREDVRKMERKWEVDRQAKVQAEVEKENLREQARRLGNELASFKFQVEIEKERFREQVRKLQLQLDVAKAQTAEDVERLARLESEKARAETGRTRTYAGD